MLIRVKQVQCQISGIKYQASVKYQASRIELYQRGKQVRGDTYRQTRDQRPVSGLSIWLLLAVLLLLFVRALVRIVCVTVRRLVDVFGDGGQGRGCGGRCGSGACRAR